MRKFHATQVVTGWRLQHINFKLQWSALMAEGTALLITVIVYQTKTGWLLVTRSLSPNSLQLVSALSEVENLIWEKIWSVEVTIGFSRQTTTVALPSELVKSYLSHTKRVSLYKMKWLLLDRWTGLSMVPVSCNKENLCCITRRPINLFH